MLDHNLLTTGVNPDQLYDTFGSTDLQVSSTDNVRAADAGFVDPATNDYHLTAGSPAIDAASATLGAALLDRDGVSRPQGAAPDIGAFETH